MVGLIFHDRVVMPRSLALNMTKRKRTPSPSPPPGAQVPFQIPASLQRLSVISRSLAHQSDRLGGFNTDGQNTRIAAQARGRDDVPPGVGAASSGTAVHNGHGQGFHAFAPRKQPSFPDAQTWVEPKTRGNQVPDTAGFMPLTQPSFPQGQTWPQPQSRKGVSGPQLQGQQTPVPAPTAAPPPLTMLPAGALATLEAAPKEGETLCLETQPHRIAALIAQKRAANELNRKREAWTRRAAAHRMSSQAPDDQLRSELNSALEQSAPNHTGKVVTGEHQAPTHPEQDVTPSAAMKFGPAVPSAVVQVDNGMIEQAEHGSASNIEPPSSQKGVHSVKSINKNTSRNHDSLFSSSASESPITAQPPKPGGAPSPQSAPLTNQHDPSEAQLSAAASTALLGAAHSSTNSAKPKSKPHHADSSFARQSPQSNHMTPVAAGYYRFNPRHWQTGSLNQQQPLGQPSPATTLSGPQSTDANTWPASCDRPHKTPSNQVFRNLTQDKFGRFSVGGKLKEAAAQPSGSGTG